MQTTPSRRVSVNALAPFVTHLTPVAQWLRVAEIGSRVDVLHFRSLLMASLLPSSNRPHTSGCARGGLWPRVAAGLVSDYDTKFHDEKVDNTCLGIARPPEAMWTNLGPR